MRPKTKADTSVTTAPEHAALLCSICGQHPLDPSTSVFTCEHGTWTFNAPGAPALPAGSPMEEQLAVLLASLDEETLQNLLDARIAANTPPPPAAEEQQKTPPVKPPATPVTK